MNKTKYLLRANMADLVADYRFSLRRLSEGEMSNEDMAAEEAYAKVLCTKIRYLFKNRHISIIGKFGETKVIGGAIAEERMPPEGLGIPSLNKVKKPDPIGSGKPEAAASGIAPMDTAQGSHNQVATQ